MNSVKHIFFSFFLLASFVECSGASTKNKSLSLQTKPISHDTWDNLLKKHVKKHGLVDYKGFVKDSVELNSYLKLLKENPPSENSWSKNERLAYWINAYNAFTISLIVEAYPVKSIKDVGPALSIPFINSVWSQRFILIGGKEYSLDDIEHSILRKEFDEPRIHFAVNCASISCPPLRSEAFLAEQIDQQLKEQTASFINDQEKNNITEKKATISKIFDWFKGDFTKDQKLFEFINQYSETKIDAKTKIRFMDYNWGLNESQNDH